MLLNPRKTVRRGTRKNKQLGKTFPLFSFPVQQLAKAHKLDITYSEVEKALCCVCLN